jgi:hypothetical protein
VYFLTLFFAGFFTLALLPACGGGGGGESCNTPEFDEGEGPENESFCEDEEVDEEELSALIENELQLFEQSFEQSEDALEQSFELSEEDGFDAGNEE